MKARVKKVRPRMDWPAVLALQIAATQRLACVRELKFHPIRKWRFDLSLPLQNLAIEVDGGGFVMGRHSRGAGMAADAEKFAEAAILGWTVIRVTPQQVQNGQALGWVERLLERRAA